MSKVFIATSRPVGQRCIEWAQDNMPYSFELCNTIEESDIVISVLYDKLFAPEIINKKKCFNFHPGSLPEYKGSGAFSWVIINNEKKCGITLHLIDDGIDTGDIIEIREFLISQTDTAISLFNKGTDVMYKMFTDWFGDLLVGNYIATKQPIDNNRLYLRKDLHKAKNLSRFIRAFYFPSKESAYYYNVFGKKVYIHYDAFK